MNPIVIAVIGVIITVVAYNLASGIQHRLWRMAAQVASVLIPVALMGLFAANPVAASDAGQYWAIGIVAAWLLGKLFGGSSKST